MAKNLTPYFKISSPARISLSAFPVCITSTTHSQTGYDARLAKNHASIEEHQVRLYAGHARSLLIIFQGMDTAGKDGAIKHVMSGVNPLSKAEQKKRLLERFRDPKKVWKISEGDIRERSFWNKYRAAYEQCLGHTSSKSSLWYIVPGDNKESARLSISQILVDRFEKMGLKYPKLTRLEQRNLKALKSLLLKA